MRQLAQALVQDDADDVVQQTYLQALRRGDAGVRSPRAWLARIVRNVARNVRRSDGRRRARETDLVSHPHVPSSAELLEREGRRTSLVRAVDALEEPLRTVVLLRYFEGLPPARIARTLGLPVTTVWNRLRRALALLRVDLERKHEDCPAWLLPLVPPGRPTHAAPHVAAVAAGVTLMTTKTKLLTAAAVLSAVLLLLVFPRRDAHKPQPARGPAAVQAPALMRPEAQPVSAAPTPPLGRRAIGQGAEPDDRPATGALAVTVLYEGAALEGIGLRLLTSESSPSEYGGVFARTDSQGQARFDALPPGACRVWTDRNRLEVPRYDVLVAAGETAQLDIDLEPGIDIAGIVVDRDGRAVAGAEVHLASVAQTGHDPGPVAFSDREGRFLLRGCGMECLIGARALGHTQAPMRLVQAHVGATVEVELRLGAPGGAVSGRIVDGAGLPVEGAVVHTGVGSLLRMGANSSGSPVPARNYTDENGEFLAIGLSPGERPVAVRAAGFGFWTGTSVVRAGATTPLLVTLLPAVACAGTISITDGSPAAGARVYAGEFGTLGWFETRADVEGAYVLDGLPEGAIDIRAELDGLGEATTQVFGVAGTTVRWDPRLSTGTLLVGRVVDEQGDPVARAGVSVSALPGASWGALVFTDEDGAFSVSNCPHAKRLSVQVFGDMIAKKTTVRDVDPVSGPLTVHVRVADEPSATIRGRVVGPDGSPCRDAMVWAIGLGTNGTGFEPCEPDTGAFELGPLRPSDYELHVRSNAHPEFTSAVKSLAAHETWDVGVIRLVSGGRVRADLTGIWPSRIQALVRDTSGNHVQRMAAGGGTLTSEPLPPGSYLLCLSGSEFGACIEPFEIEVGLTTHVSAELIPGLERAIEAALPAGDLDSLAAQLEVRTAQGVLVYKRAAQIAADRPLRARCGFIPGDYVVTASSEGRNASARFRVAADAKVAPPIRLLLE